MDDLAIIGSGPAALTAALYAARENLKVTIYEKASMGGQLSTISTIENFPGAPEGSTGASLSARLRTQAESFGAKLTYGEVSHIERTTGGTFNLTADGTTHSAKTILIATGSTPVKLGVPGENLAGVHYCATCDGAFYKGKNIAVIGGANSAVQEALFLAYLANHVTIIALYDIMSCNVLKQRLFEAETSGKIKVMTHTETVKILGDKKASGVQLMDKSGSRPQETELDIDGVFVFIGLQPQADFLKDSNVKLCSKGFVQTDSDFMTNIPGIFAAGDIRADSIKQAIVAAGEGAAAAIHIQRFLQSHSSNNN